MSILTLHLSDRINCVSGGAEDEHADRNRCDKTDQIRQQTDLDGIAGIADSDCSKVHGNDIHGRIRTSLNRRRDAPDERVGAMLLNEIRRIGKGTCPRYRTEQPKGEHFTWYTQGVKKRSHGSDEDVQRARGTKDADRRHHADQMGDYFDRCVEAILRAVNKGFVDGDFFVRGIEGDKGDHDRNCPKGYHRYDSIQVTFTSFAISGSSSFGTICR